MAGVRDDEFQIGMQIATAMLRPFIEIAKELQRERKEKTKQLAEWMKRMKQREQQLLAAGKQLPKEQTLEAVIKDSVEQCEQRMQQTLAIMENYGHGNLASEIRIGFDELKNDIIQRAGNVKSMDDYDKIADGITCLGQIQTEVDKDLRQYMENLKGFDQTKEKVNSILEDSPIQKSLGKQKDLGKSISKPLNELESRFANAIKLAAEHNANKPAQVLQQHLSQSMERALAR